MNNFNKIQMDNDVQTVQTALSKYFACGDIDQKIVIDAMSYSVLNGGKRIRSILALEFCKALGGSECKALPVACAIEMVHAYSLIHDDLPCMDNDDLRRGKPTCHKAFSEDVAVLAGDGLQTLAFEILSSQDVADLLGDAKALKCIRTISQAIGEYGMLGGQTIDVTFEGRKLSEVQHKNMVSMKTGSLIKAAVECGCLIADATTQQIELAREYGECLGLAFQMIDDILDIEGQQEILGKPVGSDQKSNKNTFVSIMGLTKTEEMSKILHDRAVEILTKLCPQSSILFDLTLMLASRSF